MPGLLTARFRDYSEEYSTMTVRVPELTGPDVWTVITGLAGGLESAAEALSLGTLVQITFSQGAIVEDDTAPSSQNAQREAGLRFFYSDDVDGSRYTVTLPAPDLTITAQPGTDLVDLTITEVAAMVTWLEANVLSPNGNAITVNSAKNVGRRN